MLVAFDEPRPWTMFRLGTMPCRPVLSVAWIRSIVSSEKAETATGTSCSDSSRRCAVTTISCSDATPDSCASTGAGNTAATAAAISRFLEPRFPFMKTSP